ncbi:MAG: hypothetical protein NMNS01_14850 [Nitrosomonas sp.]|jgi:Protein of unknown function (DUF2782)|nr:MAG: hypothetical protein NMNS01_14850 [Nitrosomonas sp.]
MHQIIFTLMLSFALPIMAQSDQPEDLQPLPELSEPPPLPELSEPPPLPPDIELDPELEPEITIIKRGEDTIEEHRINGELYMIKVIPRIGLPYYLVRNRVGGEFSHPGEAGIDVSPPMWRILEF